MSEEIPMDKWVWLGCAGHFIASGSCKFRITTEVGDILVSTMGDYYRGEERIEIGYKRFLETMCFPLLDSLCSCGCGAREVGDFAELYLRGYQTRAEARVGHMEICKMVARGEITKGKAKETKT
jgi:hypothetical protein